MKIAFLFLTIGDLNHEFLWKEYFKGNENKFVLPKPLVKEKNFNFSFSGIKTNINLLTKKNKIINFALSVL